MMVRLLIILVALSSSVISRADTICLQDVPNIGDQTCTTTYSTGTTTTTSNLISETFNDGTWNGTMFPDSSDLNESTYLTGKDGKYAETTINSVDLMTINELRQGFTSNFTADIRWWNKWQSTVTMSQTAVSGNGDTTTQTLLLTDTTDANYEFSNYGNTLIVTPNTEYTHGTLTARFDFDVEQSAGNWNSYHSGVDVTDPSLILDYTTLTEATNTTVKFCWEFTPSTCPQAVEDIAETIVNIEDDLTVIIQDIEAPEIEIDLPIITYEPEIIEVDEPQIEIEILSIETVDMIPDVDTVEVLSIPVETSMIEEEITTEELIDAYDTEPVVETTTNDEPSTPEPDADPIEMVEQNDEPIEEQPSSEEVVAEQPIQETDSTKQEEVVEADVEESGPEPIEEPVEEDIVEVVEEESEVSVDVVAVEKYIDGKVQSQIEKVEATLLVVNELVNRAMVSNQVDISSYGTINAAMFDNRQLPKGNQDFFKQIVLAGYDKTIYNDQVSLVAIDPVAQHSIKVNEARDKTDKAYYKLKALMEARQ